MNDTKKTVSLAAICSVSATWFSVHAGGGFASGSQTMGFVTRYGFHAIWTPFLVVALIALAYRELLILGKNNNVYNFRQLTDVLYHPHEKIFSPLYEFFNIIANVMAIASCVAGGATVFQDAFGLNYAVGIVLIGLLMLVLSIYGRDLVLKAGTLFSVAIFICVLIISIVALTNGNAHPTQWMQAPEAHKAGLGIVLLKVFSYAGFQCWGPVAAMLGVSEILRTDSNINKALGIGFVINAIMLWLTNFVMMGYMPECTSSALPLYYVCETTGHKAVIIAYIVALFSAYISTGVGVVFGMVKRYSPLVMNKKPDAKPSVVNAIVGALFIGLTVLISTIGLTNIIKYGFGYMGYVGIILVFIPAITVAHVKNKKFKAEHPDFDVENLQRDITEG